MAEKTWRNEMHDLLPPEGPWADEPDKIQWIDEATDLDCLMVRNRFGAWCGYVGVPPGHPWHGQHYGDVPEVQVHGGLTFANSCDEEAPEGTGICHIPEPGRPADIWWLGFDCGHAFDQSPAMEERERKYGWEPISGTTYREVSYVQNEIRDLAQQVKEAANG